MRFLTISGLVHRTRCKPSLVSIGRLKRLLTLTAIAFIVWIGTTPTAWGQYIREQTYTFTADSIGLLSIMGYSVSGAGDVRNC